MLFSASWKKIFFVGKWIMKNISLLVIVLAINICENHVQVLAITSQKTQIFAFVLNHILASRLTDLQVGSTLSN